MKLSLKDRFFPPRIGDPVFSRQQIIALLVPLIIEQILTQTIGLIGSIMVSSAGVAAFSGVALVDSINSIVLSLFTSLAIGGTIVTSQFIGRGDKDSARVSAQQVVIVSTGIAAVCGLLCVVFRYGLLDLVYNVEADVMESAAVYFLITACSFPFMALFAASSAIFRAAGNARLPMLVSVWMNLINFGCNALFIFVFKLGAAGPALSALISRAIGSLIVSIKLGNKKLDINIAGILPLRINIPMIKNILAIGIPSGVENSLLQVGRLLNQSITSSFGTAAIAAASIGNHINVVTLMPGSAVGNALLTVVGQCVGAGKQEQARRYTTSFVLIGLGSMVVLNLLFLVFMDNVIAMFINDASTPELAMAITELSRRIVIVLCIASCFFAPFSFTLPNALRAANDVKFTMVMSLFSMFPVRILMGYLMSFHTPIREMGIWYALMLDWGFKGIACIIRFAGTKWTSHKILKGSAAKPKTDDTPKPELEDEGT